MWTFKDAVKNDIMTTFFNDEEFSELHKINGKEMHVIIDNNELLERGSYGKKGQKEYTKDLTMAHRLIYVPVDELGYTPRISSLMELDKRTYRVIDCINEDGIYSIELEVNRIG